MNKKGVFAIKLFTFILASLIVSVIIVVFFAKAVPNMMLGSVEDVMAKDFGLTIMTISASPYDITYSYEKNTEAYSFFITDEEVKVQSRDALGKYNYLPMANIIIIKNTIVEGVLSIPLTLEKNTLSFSSNTVGIEDFCSSIPMTFFENNLDVKIIVDSKSTQENVAYLESIKAGIELRISTAENIRLTEYDEDLLIILSSGQNSPSISYYETRDEKEDSAEWIKRIACYNSKWIGDKYSQLGEVALTPNSEVNTMRIYFGNANLIEGKFVIAQGDASKEITNAISLGITK